MESYLQFLPLLNLLFIPIMRHMIKHEKCHTRIEVLLENVCKKLDIETKGR